MKILIPPGPSGNIIASIAIGGSFFQTWHDKAYPNWRGYCERHGLGLVIFDTNLNPADAKSFQWQKLLMGTMIRKELPQVKNVCHLDTDILISPSAPNIFDIYNPEQVALISQRYHLPYPSLEAVQRREAFLRHTCYSQEYPLDSILFASLDTLYGAYNLPPQADYACTGVFVFNLNNHADLFQSWFDKYRAEEVNSAGRAAEEAYLNYELLHWGKIQWLDYRYQALWVYEMAWKYPFLYHDYRDNLEIQTACVEASLFANHFLHFAGSWHESGVWKAIEVFRDPAQKKRFAEFAAYENTPVTGHPKGEILPRK